MLMLKAPVYKDHRFIFRQNDVRFSRKPGIVLSVPKSFGKQVFTHDFLGLCVFAPNAGHIVASLLWIVDVRHDILPL